METKFGAVRQPDGDLSYAERDACLHALGELHAGGHLTFSELEKRIQAALAAETEEELARLVPELPETKAGSRSSFGGEAATTTPTRSTPAVVVGAATAVVATLGVALAAVGGALVTAALLVARGSYGLLLAVARWVLQKVAELRRPQACAVPAADLDLAPRPQAPAPWQPIKVYAVRVPMDEEPAAELDTARVAELPSAARPALAASPATVRGELPAAPEAPADELPPQEDGVRAVFAQRRLLLSRVTHRDPRRRSGIFPRQRTTHS